MELAQLTAIISAARVPEDVFGDITTPEELKKLYGQFAFLTHPDRHPAAQEAAAKTFQDVLDWMHKAKAKMDRGTYGDRTVMADVVITTKAGVYTLTERIAEGAIADLLGGTVVRGKSTTAQVAVKVVRSPRNNDLMRAEAETLKGIHTGATGKPYQGDLMFIPKVLGSFDVGERKGRTLRQRHQVDDRLRESADVPARTGPTGCRVDV